MTRPFQRVMLALVAAVLFGCETPTDIPTLPPLTVTVCERHSTIGCLEEIRRFSYEWERTESLEGIRRIDVEHGPENTGVRAVGADIGNDVVLFVVEHDRSSDLFYAFQWGAGFNPENDETRGQRGHDVDRMQEGDGRRADRTLRLFFVEGIGRLPSAPVTAWIEGESFVSDSVRVDPAYHTLRPRALQIRPDDLDGALPGDIRFSSVDDAAWPGFPLGAMWTARHGWFVLGAYRPGGDSTINFFPREEDTEYELVLFTVAM